MGKKGRMVAIFYRALAGECISVAGLAAEYGVSERSISRDIHTIKHFLLNNRGLVGDTILEYDSRRKCYRIKGDCLI